jgi:RNA polymerase sigma factor (sigma-70 family)
LVERDYRDLKLWQRGTSLPIYLKVVIRHFVIDFHRANRSRKKIKGTLTQQALIDEPEVKKGRKPAATVAKEEITLAIELKELRSLGVQAWAKLDARDRFIVCGKLHRELSNEAMAERLKLTGGALRTALSRAQEKLLLGVKTLAPEYFPA